MGPLCLQSRYGSSPQQSQLGRWAAGMLGASASVHREEGEARRGGVLLGIAARGGAHKVNKEALLGRQGCRKTEFCDRGFPAMEDVILTGEERTAPWVLWSGVVSQPQIGSGQAPPALGPRLGTAYLRGWFRAWVRLFIPHGEGRLSSSGQIIPKTQDPRP